jgi:hypothetical protein
VEELPVVEVEDTTIADLEGKIIDLENQVDNSAATIDNLNGTIQELLDKLAQIPIIQVPEAVDIAGAIADALDMAFPEAPIPQAVQDQLNALAAQGASTADDVPQAIQAIQDALAPLGDIPESLTSTLGQLAALAGQQPSINVQGSTATATATAMGGDPCDPECKPRIFANNTLVYNINDPIYVYIIENGVKRFLQFDEDLLFIIAKALGKIKIVEGIEEPDVIPVPSLILEQIPDGKVFTGVDLVSTKPSGEVVSTDPSVTGKGLIAKWIYPVVNGMEVGRTAEKPLIVQSGNSLPSNVEMTIDLQVKYATVNGVVNTLEVWDQNTGTTLFTGKPALPIKEKLDPDTTYQEGLATNFKEYTDSIKLILKDTSTALKPGTATVGLDFVDRYRPIQFSGDVNSFRFTLTPRVTNDAGEEEHDLNEVLHVLVKFGTAMPSLANVGKTLDRAIGDLGAIGVPYANIRWSYGNRDATKDQIVYSQLPAPGTTINPATTIVTLVAYQGSSIRVPLFQRNDNFNNVVKAFKDAGFTNLNTKTSIRSQYPTDHYTVPDIASNGNPVQAGSYLNYDAPIYFGINIYNKAMSTYYGKEYWTINEDSVQIELKSVINNTPAPPRTTSTTSGTSASTLTVMSQFA